MGVFPSNDFYSKADYFKGSKHGGGIFRFNGSSKGFYIYPETHNRQFEDIGWKYLIGKDTGKSVNGGIDYILQHFQTVRIIEAIQESKIDMILNAWKNFKNGFSTAGKMLEKMKDEKSDFSAFYIVRKLTDSDFIKKALGLTTKATDNIEGLDESDKTWLSLAYNLKYNLVNRHVMNTYYLPYDGTQLYQTNGTDGWGQVESGFGSTSSHSLIGKILNFVGSTIRIKSEPIWQGTSQDSQTQIQIKMNLFNDTRAKAISNFVFINNIVPHNMYLQYGFVQQAPAYYDILIEGNRRYPLCKGSMVVNAKGIIRDMGDIQNVKANEAAPYTEEIKKYIKDNHPLRVPDVYEITLTFQSLLPDSYNDFLHFWYQKESEMTMETTSQFSIDQSEIDGMLSEAALYSEARYQADNENDQQQQSEDADESRVAEEQQEMLE